MSIQVSVWAGCLCVLLGVFRGHAAEPARTEPGTLDMRVATRTFPSVFQAWSPIENIPEESELELMARHDLVFRGTWGLRLNWEISPEQPYQGLSTALINQEGSRSLDEARKRRARLQELNPNLILLSPVLYREGRFVAEDRDVDLWQQGDYPPDSDFWLKDEDGNLCPGWGDDSDGDGTVEQSEIHFMLVDFTDPELQDLIATKALALKNTGVFDGIMLDWWNEHHATSHRWPDGNGTLLTHEDERSARVAMLRKIRSLVGDDFLILVNSNFRTVPGSAPFINGLFMECWKPNYDAGYQAKDVRTMEATLGWAEKNLKEPRINCLEGWRVVSNYAGDRADRVNQRNSAVNLQSMRMITALGLTHSDGYVLFADDNAQPSPDHLHNWYDFWDADLGTPECSGEAQDDGSFRREFSKGTVVYNPPGNSPVTIEFDEPRVSAASAREGKRHSVDAADGDVFLNPQ